jgi:hypothetical protein
MDTGEIHVESLVGHRLRDVDGTSLGRIEEIVAEVEGTDWVVVEVHVGPGALLERLVELSTIVPFLERLPRRFISRYRIPWAYLDLTNPKRPRATVRRSGLERLSR